MRGGKRLPHRSSSCADSASSAICTRPAETTEPLAWRDTARWGWCGKQSTIHLNVTARERNRAWERERQRQGNSFKYAFHREVEPKNKSQNVTELCASFWSPTMHECTTFYSTTNLKPISCTVIIKKRI